MGDITAIEFVQITDLDFALIRQWQGMRRREPVRESLEGGRGM